MKNYDNKENKSVLITLGGKEYRGRILSWTEFNAETRRAQKEGNIMEYLGADMDYRKKMYCAFQETSIKSLKKGKPDELGLYFVENDVVFKFQKDNKKIERQNYKGDEEEKTNEKKKNNNNSEQKKTSAKTKGNTKRK